MASYKSEFLNIMDERGLIYQCSDLEGLDDTLSSGVKTAYVGYDATATSLHIGHLISIMMLRRFQQAGHKPVVLMGGGTTRIGDPSGKDDMRQMLDDAAIDANIASLQKTFAKYLDFSDGETAAKIVNNADWLLDINYISFLRDYGRHFSINRMMGLESVKQRLDREQPLSFLEFNYSILQAYDFVELFRNHDVVLQMGGSDQWGNIISGVELGRRVLRTPLYALTCPLFLNSEGKKMGKTASGAVWLNEDKLPPYDFYQYWRNVADADIGKILRFFTDLPMDEVRRLESLQGAEINDAKKLAAFEITAMCHGVDAAKQAEKTAQETFEKGGAGDDLPTIILDAALISSGLPLIDLLPQTGLVSSKGEARRMIQQGGVKLDNEKVTDIDALTPKEISNDGLKVSVGKKKHALVKLG